MGILIRKQLLVDLVYICGGNVKKDIVGKQKYLIALMHRIILVALIVPGDWHGRVLMIWHPRNQR